MAKIIGWHSETWNSESAKVLLNNLQKNKGQTNETREHAALILSWMNLRQTISSSPTSAAAAAAAPPAAVGTAIGSRGESNEEEKGVTSLRNRRDSDLSSTMSPRSSLHLATDSGAISGTGTGAGLKPGIGNSGEQSSGSLIPLRSCLLISLSSLPLSSFLFPQIYSFGFQSMATLKLELFISMASQRYRGGKYDGRGGKERRGGRGRREESWR
jgi:hypothetical protein